MLNPQKNRYQIITKGWFTSTNNRPSSRCKSQKRQVLLLTLVTSSNTTSIIKLHIISCQIVQKIWYTEVGVLCLVAHIGLSSGGWCLPRVWCHICILWLRREVYSYRTLRNVERGGILGFLAFLSVLVVERHGCISSRLSVVVVKRGRSGCSKVVIVNRRRSICPRFLVVEERCGSIRTRSPIVEWSWSLSPSDRYESGWSDRLLARGWFREDGRQESIFERAAGNIECYGSIHQTLIREAIKFYTKKMRQTLKLTQEIE